MSEKPMTREEFRASMFKSTGADGTTVTVVGAPWHRISATLDALFDYRERTRGFYRAPDTFHVVQLADTIARELGLE